MTDRIDRIQGVLEMLQLDSVDELDHVLECETCYLFDSYDGGGPHYCREFWQEFRGWTYVATEASPEAQIVMKLWGPEMLAMMMPVLRFEQNAVKKGDDN